MNILFPVEIASRELLYKVYLCHLLAMKGFNCYLGKKDFIWDLTQKMKDYIYIDKGYHEKISDKLYDQIKYNGGIIINLDEEGAVDYSNNSTLLNRYSEKMISKVDCVFLWGKYQFDLLKSNINQNNKVIVTGHPRFELLRKRFHLFYEEEVEKINDQYGNLILINTNMGFGNNIKGDDFIIDDYGGRFPNIREIIEFDKIKMREYVSLIKDIYPYYNGSIVLRPHPEEDLSYYKNAFNNYSKVKVINAGSVVPWIIASELMIHPDCTTSIESILLGKKPISFLPHTENQSIITDLPVRVSHRIKNVNELISFIKNKESFKLEINNIDKEILENNFSVLLDSSDMIVNKITSIFDENIESDNSNINLSDRMSLNYRSLKFMINYGKPAKLIRKKLSGFTRKTIKKIHAKCCVLDYDLSKVKVQRISDMLYKFSIN